MNTEKKVRGRKTGVRDWTLISLGEFKKHGFGDNFAIKVNRRWLEQMGLLSKLQTLDTPKVETLEAPEKSESIQFEVIEPENAEVFPTDASLN